MQTKSKIMSIKATWLGHACVLLESSNKTILIDPWIENPKFPGEEYMPSKIDLMLVTHGHYDHFGNVIELAKKYNSSIIVIVEMANYIRSQLDESYSGEIVGMNLGGTYDFEDVKISLVPSSHSSSLLTSDPKTYDKREAIYLGSATGYVIHFPDGNSFYHCGDTGATKEMEVIADLFSPKYGFLTIGGHFTMDPKGAAYASKMLRLKGVIPIHWGTFIPPLTGTPDELKAYLKDSGIEIYTLNPGDSKEFS